MPRTALLTTLVALALLAGVYVLPHAPAADAVRAGLQPLAIPIGNGLPIAPLDGSD